MAGLTGRRSECDVLDRLISAVRAGESRALVVRGEPGVGKTALLEYLVEQASGCRVAPAGGVQSEMELAFAGLHQLCAPMLDRLDGLPAPQGDALRTAFGISAGPAPDRFLIGLAVLGLFSDVAEERPLICVVDDQQWLDRTSAQVLGFVARRLDADSVGLVIASRAPRSDLAGLPELLVEGLPEGEARALLDSVLTGPVDAQVRDQIVAETRGNPLALVELPRGLTPAELAGGFGLPGAVPLSGRIEGSFRRRVDALPAETRRLLLVAAADPVGDPMLVWRAAGRLGIQADAATPAAEAGLLEFGARVRFRHPLVRSAAYRSASLEERQAVHGALAEVTDPQADPDRRAWHRAQAAPGPDEEVAAELERSAGRAAARGGLAAHLVAIDLPGFGRSQRRDALLSPRAMGAFVIRVADAFGLENPHVIGPDIGTAASLFAAALYPGRLRSLVVGSGGSAFPLQLGGVLKDWVEAPDLGRFRSADPRQIVGGALSGIERYALPDCIREDCLESYDGDRFVESMRYVQTYPTKLPALRDLLPQIRTPVQIIAGALDTAVPPVNAEFLHERLPRSRLDIIDAGHFTWEDGADAYAAVVTSWWSGGYAGAHPGPGGLT